MDTTMLMVDMTSAWCCLSCWITVELVIVVLFLVDGRATEVNCVVFEVGNCFGI